MNDKSPPQNKRHKPISPNIILLINLHKVSQSFLQNDNRTNNKIPTKTTGKHNNKKIPDKTKLIISNITTSLLFSSYINLHFQTQDSPQTTIFGHLTTPRPDG
jgi:hypothetical protein